MVKVSGAIRQYLINQKVRLLYLAYLMAFAFLSVYNAKADTVIGVRSYAAECYLKSQKAATSGSASRIDLDKCTRAINEIGLLAEDLVGSYVNRGIIQMALGRDEQALKDLNRALALNSRTGEAYVNRGNLRFSQGRLDEAIEDYDLAINFGIKQLHIAYLNRGIAREALGYLSAAQRDYKSAIAIRNTWPDAIARLERVNKAIEQELKKRAALKG